MMVFYSPEVNQRNLFVSEPTVMPGLLHVAVYTKVCINMHLTLSIRMPFQNDAQVISKIYVGGGELGLYCPSTQFRS